MGKAEEKYRYLLNKDKYDPEVQQAVSKKDLPEKDANTVYKIQQMMRNEKQAKNIVTSENREEFIEKKLAEKAGKKPSGEGGPKEKPHGIFHSETDELHSHYPTHDEAYKIYSNLRKNYDYAIGELSEKELKKHGYKK
jgi:hypothetical protein